MSIAVRHAMSPTVPIQPGVASHAGGVQGPFDLNHDDTYRNWRDRKLALYPRDAAELRVELRDFAVPTPSEQSAVRDAIGRANMAIYRPHPDVVGGSGSEGARDSVRQLAASFGLVRDEQHRSADADGIVAIEATEQVGKRGFIPYSRRAMNWHTDGYYNAPADSIRAMLLHCVRPARAGGANALLDPEILYIRLRDRDPALVAALMHPQAMTIPESIEEDGSVRVTSTGPVFFIDNGGTLVMRYTARTRSIAWRDDADTHAALALIERLLQHEEEPLILRTRLEAGEGLICNNVLHARTAFEDGDDAGRLLLRARFRQRVSCN